jgi:hypothetical protein
VKFHLRSLILVVAVAATLMAAWRILGPVVFYNSGPHQFILRTAQSVLVVGEPGEAIPVRTLSPGGLSALPVGTRCIVLDDHAKNADDCWTDRTIVVRIAEEPHRGETVAITRSKLRAR